MKKGFGFLSWKWIKRKASDKVRGSILAANGIILKVPNIFGPFVGKMGLLLSTAASVK